MRTKIHPRIVRSFIPVKSAFFLIVVLLCMPVQMAFASETVMLPRYTPMIGAEYRYRSLKSIEIDIKPDASDDKAPVRMETAQGDFSLVLHVLSQDADGYLMHWSLSADAPKDAVKEARVYALNDNFRETIKTYGTEDVTLETTANGSPVALVNAAQILENLRSNAMALIGTIPSLRQIMQYPDIIIDILVPEAALLALGQADSDMEMTVGESWTVSGAEKINGIEIPTSSTWLVEAMDPVQRTVTFSMMKTFDSAALGKEQEKPAEITVPDLSKLTGSAARFLVSLEDGSTLEAIARAKIVTVDVITNTLTIHLYREDRTASLSMSE